MQGWTCLAPPASLDGEVLMHPHPKVRMGHLGPDLDQRHRLAGGHQTIHQPAPDSRNVFVRRAGQDDVGVPRQPAGGDQVMRCSGTAF